MLRQALLGSYITRTCLAKKDYTISMQNLKSPSPAVLAIMIILIAPVLVEAVQKQNWLNVAIFLALVVLVLWVDMRKK